MLIDWKLVLSLSIPAVIAVIGWFFAHKLTSHRERLAKRREIRLKGLELAYLKLSMASNRDWTEERMLDFEKFIAEIQLYGTPRQIELMIELVKAFIDKKPEISFDPLLQDLRDSLREELSMERITDTIWWYRFKLPEWKIKKEPNSERSASP